MTPAKTIWKHGALWHRLARAERLLLTFVCKVCIEENQLRRPPFVSAHNALSGVGHRAMSLCTATPPTRVCIYRARLVQVRSYAGWQHRAKALTASALPAGLSFDIVFFVSTVVIDSTSVNLDSTYLFC